MKQNKRQTFFLLFSVFLSLLLFSSETFAWWDASWTKRRKITFSNGSSENLANFTVLVKVDSTRIDYANVQASGQDLHFIDSDDATVLDYQIEEYNESGSSYIWVEVPQIDNGTTDFIYMYYGNAGAAAYTNANNTWNADGNYKGVWHLHSDLNDSASTGYTLTDNGTTSNASPAQIADGQTMNGTTQYLSRAYTLGEFDFGTGSFTIEGWFKSSGSTASSTFEKRVSASTDDAEEASGTMDLTSTDLEIGYDASAQYVGMRFNSITIPQGATITTAYIQFTADETNSTTPFTKTIWGEAADNASTFTSTANNLSGRADTTATVSWTIPAWPTADVAGDAQKTPEIKTVIQEIIDRAGWASGNSMVIFTDPNASGTIKRTAEAYNGVAGSAPLLHIEYTAAAAQQIVSRYDSDQGFKVWMESDGKVAFGVDDDLTWSPDYQATSSASTYDDNAWHHFAAVKNANTNLYLYIDGAQVGSNSNLTPAAADFSVQVAASADDAEQRTDTNAVSTSSSDLELVVDTVDQQVGMRFLNVTVPQGSTINTSTIQFTADSSPGSGIVALTLTGEAADNAAIFTSTANDIGARSKTTASVAWSPGAWTASTANAASKTPDLSTIVDEITDRSGWASGNAMVFFVDGSDTNIRRAISYDGGASSAALLAINYTAPALGTLTSDSAVVRVGTDTPAAQQYFNGSLDDIRISNTARSANWVAKDYASMNDSFATFGSEENAPSGTRRILIVD